MTVKWLQQKVEICETHAMTRTRKFNNNNKMPVKSNLKWQSNQHAATTTARNQRHLSISASFVADCQWVPSSNSSIESATQSCCSITMSISPTARATRAASASCLKWHPSYLLFLDCAAHCCTGICLTMQPLHWPIAVGACSNCCCYCSRSFRVTWQRRQQLIIISGSDSSALPE